MELPMSQISVLRKSLVIGTSMWDISVGKLITPFARLKKCVVQNNFYCKGENILRNVEQYF